MKKLLFAAVAMAALSVQSLNAQDQPRYKSHLKGTTTFAAPVRNRPRPVVEIQQSPVQGIIPRASRLDQPMQMVNPVAPREYGTGEEYISGYNDEPGQGPKNQKNNVLGFKLFSLEF